MRRTQKEKRSGDSENEKGRDRVLRERAVKGSKRQ